MEVSVLAVPAVALLTSLSATTVRVSLRVEVSAWGMPGVLLITDRICSRRALRSASLAILTSLTSTVLDPLSPAWELLLSALEPFLSLLLVPFSAVALLALPELLSALLELFLSPLEACLASLDPFSAVVTASWSVWSFWLSGGNSVILSLLRDSDWLEDSP